jgi:hypothetical protein
MSTHRSRSGTAATKGPVIPTGMMTAAEVAEYWGVHIATVRRWSSPQKIREGNRTKTRPPLLEKHPIGRRKVAFERAEVERLFGGKTPARARKTA